MDTFELYLKYSEFFEKSENGEKYLKPILKIIHSNNKTWNKMSTEEQIKFIKCLPSLFKDGYIRHKLDPISGYPIFEEDERWQLEKKELYRINIQIQSYS